MQKITKLVTSTLPASLVNTTGLCILQPSLTLIIFLRIGTLSHVPASESVDKKRAEILALCGDVYLSCLEKVGNLILGKFCHLEGIQNKEIHKK